MRQAINDMMRSVGLQSTRTQGQLVPSHLVPKLSRTHGQLVPKSTRTHGQVVPKSCRTQGQLVPKYKRNAKKCGNLRKVADVNEKCHLSRKQSNIEQRKNDEIYIK